MSSNIRQIIIAPLLTEKCSNQREVLVQSRTQRQAWKKNPELKEAPQAHRYTFKVSINANKIEIRKAVEKIFAVKVTAVNTIRQKGKVKRIRGFEGKRPDWKKAIVTLKAGDMIPDFDMV